VYGKVLAVLKALEAVYDRDASGGVLGAKELVGQQTVAAQSGNVMHHGGGGAGPKACKLTKPGTGKGGFEDVWQEFRPLEPVGYRERLVTEVTLAP